MRFEMSSLPHGVMSILETKDDMLEVAIPTGAELEALIIKIRGNVNGLPRAQAKANDGFGLTRNWLVPCGSDF